jgi:hypothetical protein
MDHAVAVPPLLKFLYFSVLEHLGSPPSLWLYALYTLDLVHG